MEKILVLGSLNMDLVTRVERTPRVGETVSGQGLAAIPGGKGANQAVTIGRLGGRVAMIGRVGDDGYGQELRRNLQLNGVSDGLVQTAPGQPTGTALIMVNKDGDNSIVVIPGANYALQVADIQGEQLADCAYLLAQLETPLEVTEKAFALGRQAGVRTVLNPAPAKELPRELLALTDLLIPNETEWEALTGQSPLDEAAIAEGAAWLRQRGVKEVLVTLGQKGACHVGPGGELTWVSAFSVTAVDTTGAGDAFIGGLLFGLARGEELAWALRRGAATAALTVTRIGAQAAIPTRPEVDKMMEGNYA